MRIASIEIIDTCPDKTPGWNPVFVRIRADNGISGIGEMAPAYSGSIQAAVRHLEVHGPALLGKDAFQIRNITRSILGGAWGQPCLMLGHVASAVDVALHDLKAKTLGVPVYDLIGGRVHENIRVYANGWCYDLREPGEYAKAAREVLDAGFTALKFDPFRYLEGGVDWANPSPGASLRSQWMRTALDRLEAVREEVGPETDLMLECHGKFDAPTAVHVAEKTFHLNLFWIEEPSSGENATDTAALSEKIPMPVASGERLVGRQSFRPYIENYAAAILQPDLGMVGGLTEARAISEYAQQRGILMAPHNAGGPVCTAASIHLDVATPNFLIQETFPFRPPGYVDFAENSFESLISNGFIHAPDSPGLGIELKPLDSFPHRMININ